MVGSAGKMCKADQFTLPRIWKVRRSCLVKCATCVGQKATRIAACGVDIDSGQVHKTAGPLWLWMRPNTQELKASAHYKERMHAVSEFNASNVWRKRGLAITPSL